MPARTPSLPAHQQQPQPAPPSASVSEECHHFTKLLADRFDRKGGSGSRILLKFGRPASFSAIHCFA
jgi:hypothetical protein